MPVAPRVVSVWQSEQVFLEGCIRDPASPSGHHLVQRLKTRGQFQAVLAGSRLASGAHFVVHHLAPNEASPGSPTVAEAAARQPLFAPAVRSLGAMVPKRWARRAVTRNAIKRQIYNIGGLFESCLPQGAFVVRLRSGFDKSTFPSASSAALKQAVREELIQLLTRVSQPGKSMPLQSLAK